MYTYFLFFKPILNIGFVHQKSLEPAIKTGVFQYIITICNLCIHYTGRDFTMVIVLSKIGSKCGY